jgi:hypothetical protein
VAVSEEIFIACGQRVEGVAGFVEDGFDVTLDADRVHENEREAGFGESCLVTTGGFAFAVGEVEEFKIVHLPETRGEVGVEFVENRLCALHQSFNFFERTERRLVFRIDGEIPRTKFSQTEILFASIVEAMQERHDVLLDSVVEFEAVVGRVVEAAAMFEFVIAIVREPGVFRDFLAESEHLVEDVFEFVFVLKTPLGDKRPGFFAQRAIRFFQITAHLNERFFFATEIDGLGAGDFLVLLAQAVVLGFQRDVFFAEDFDVNFGVFVVKGVAGFGKFLAGRMSQVALVEPEMARLHLRLDFFDEFEKGFFGVGVVGVAGHRDVTAGAFFFNGAGKFAPVEEPLFKGARGIDFAETGFEFLVKRTDLGPVAKIEFGGDEATGLISGQIRKWQQTHGFNSLNTEAQRGKKPSASSVPLARIYRLEFNFAQVFQADGNLFFDGRRFVFDEIIFHVALFGLFQNGRPIHHAGADRDVVLQIGFGVEAAGFGAFAHIFNVHEFPASGIFLEPLHGVMSRMYNPKNVHFVGDEFRVGVFDQVIHIGFAAIRSKFESVAVVEELDAVFGENFAGVVEDFDGILRFGHVIIVFVIGPGATGVFQAERFGFGGDAFRIAFEFGVRKVAADRFEAALFEFLFEFFRRQIVGAGEFDFLEAERFGFVERHIDVLAEISAQTVKLQPDRPFKAFADTNLFGAERDRRS